MNKSVKMFLSFLKIGAFTFGGGYAMIPLIEAEVVNKNNWITKEEFMDILVMSQSLPGALAINSAIFIGYKIGGFLGAILGLLGVVLPSFLIILIVATAFMQFRDNYYVNLAFKGISAAVPMLVLIAVVSLSKSVPKTKVNYVLIVLAVILLTVFKVNPVFVIIAAAIFGIIFYKGKVS
ncbi:chromate transporter [Clostridium fallax]|uniref:Chromate transporter n=1 Tax=Clostridium fallax TaxID=1533 RepID=A0A1M4TU16_9CLOT|nr:chromate transporter [Clostridium fallax]SHE47918.1 chromate transporter [Clostridium fallax]SQB22396.1 chromate transport protein [Clostridium fallax]